LQEEEKQKKVQVLDKIRKKHPAFSNASQDKKAISSGFFPISSLLLDLLVHGVALEEFVVLLDLEALRGVFAVLFFFWVLRFERRSEVEVEGRGERARRALPSFVPSFRRWSKSIRALKRCLNAKHFRFHSAQTLHNINAQPKQKIQRSKCPGKARIRRGFDLPFFVARAAAAAVAFASVATFPFRFLPTFCVVYLDGVPPSERASVHSSVTMQRMPGIIGEVGRERKTEEKRGEGVSGRIAKARNSPRG
jgi:hypothetical protein